MRMLKRSLAFMLAISMVLSMTAVAAEEGPLTRGELALFLFETFEWEYDSSMAISHFTDVPEDSPYYEAVCIAVHKGITNGTGATTFSPNSTITRGQLATFLYRAGLPSAVPEEVPSDVATTAYYYEGTCAVLAHGIMETDADGLFNPNKTAYLSDVNVDAIEPVLAPTTSSAANLDLANGSIVISENAKGVTVFQQGDTEIRTSAAAGIIRQTNNSTATTNTITVESGAVNLTISGINIESTDSAPIYVKPGAVLTLTLVSENTVEALDDYAGVQVPSGAELIICGSGSLIATSGGFGAGIGGKTDGYVGTITINSGTVTAISFQGAGIGRGYDGNGGSIIINGGTVTAASKGRGAGIGGGDYADGCEITINGGDITATGGSGAAGVGGGYSGAGNKVAINGGNVTITGGRGGAGIGGGESGAGGSVTISKANVIVQGYFHAIGGGSRENQRGCDSVVIEDSATVDLSHAYSTESAVQEKITINAPVLDAAALSGNAAILSVDAYGASGLAYQWQVSADNSTWTDLAGETNAIVSVPMSADNDGHYYRCALTNGWGNTIYTESARAYILAFAKQPTSVDAELNDLVAFEVTPSCNNVTYQWQRSYDDGLSWQDVESETYSTLLLSAALDDANAKYRCIITATNGDSLASDAVEINLDLGETVIYAIDVYQQTPDGAGYDLISHEVFESEIGEEVSAPAQSFDGFYENTELSVPSGVVTEDGALVLSRYFDRETYVIDFETNGGTAVSKIKALYSAEITTPAAPSRYGYTFGGWYADADLTEAFVFDTMPLGGATVYAKWTALGEGRGIEYTIERMGMYDVNAHEEYTSIPQDQFLLEVEVTNESSTTVDAIMLVQYSAEGQMLDLEYLYSNTGIGETALFGTMIDNRDGRIGCIKAFVVPTVGSMIPLAESKMIGEMGDGGSADIAISSITVSGATGSSDYIYYDEFEYDDGVFVGELWDSIEPSNTSFYDYGRLKVKVNADDSDATIYVESDGDYTYGDDNEVLYIEISEDEYDNDCVILYITVEDSDGYETEYELTVWLEY